jgi:Family of unknown function (DUF5995)
VVATMTATPSLVGEVVDRLREIDLALPADDGVAVFNAIYLQVTERIATELESGSTFRDGAFMAELDVRFAGLWLTAYDTATAGSKVPSAWAPLFEERSTPGILPVQYALAGMNAHIEHDLPMAVVATCRSRGVTPRRRSVRQDYDSVNDLLALAESEVRRSFLSEIGQHLDDEVAPVAHLVNAWNIEKARDLAWVSAETIWATRELAQLSTRYAAMLGHTVGLASRCLLTPVGRGLASGPVGGL